jgi:hypothetical protein
LHSSPRRPDRRFLRYQGTLHIRWTRSYSSLRPRYPLRLIFSSSVPPPPALHLIRGLQGAGPARHRHNPSLKTAPAAKGNPRAKPLQLESTRATRASSQPNPSTARQARATSYTPHTHTLTPTEHHLGRLTRWLRVLLALRLSSTPPLLARPVPYTCHPHPSPTITPRI